MCVLAPTNGGRNHCCYDVKIGGTTEFGGSLAQPSAVLVDGGVYAYPVGSRQFDGTSFGVYGVGDVKTVQFGIVVGMIVYISPIVAVQDVVGADTAAVYGVGSQAAAVERKCLLRHPFGPVLAVVEYVVGDVSRCAGIVFPRDVVQIVECAVFYRLGIGVGPAVSNSVVVECFGRIVLAAGQLDRKSVV